MELSRITCNALEQYWDFHGVGYALNGIEHRPSKNGYLEKANKSGASPIRFDADYVVTGKSGDYFVEAKTGKSIDRDEYEYLKDKRVMVVLYDKGYSEQCYYGWLKDCGFITRDKAGKPETFLDDTWRKNDTEIGSGNPYGVFDLTTLTRFGALEKYIDNG